MIALRLVPKVLKAVTHIWAPNAYIISFKLETDNRILIQKSKEALKKYKHQVSLNYYIYCVIYYYYPIMISTFYYLL
jgi:phosphopantothenate-cysteine ligase